MDNNVYENPVPDWPRLIHAARLGRGDKHGELIALQIEEAVHYRLQSDNGLVWKELRKLGAEALERELSTRFLAHPAVLNGKDVYFERGFPGSLETTGRLFLDHGKELLKLAPFLQVTLKETAGLGVELAESGLLTRIRRVEFNEGLMDSDVEALVSSPTVSNLLTLEIGGPHCGQRSLDAMAASPYLENLESLAFYGELAPTPTENYENWQEYGCATQMRNIRLPPEGQALEERYGYKKWLHEASRHGYELVFLVAYDEEMVAQPPDWARAELKAAGLDHLIFPPPHERPPYKPTYWD